MEKLVIICLILFTLGAILACLLIAKIQSKHSFKCGHCGKEFEPNWTQMVFEIHVAKDHKIKCPHCNVKDFCKDQGKSVP